MPTYLAYLLRRLDAARGTGPVIVNCTGLGAKELVPDHDLRPLRGQHVVVTNPGLTQLFFQRDRRPGDERPDELPRPPRRATDGRVRRPGPPQVRAADQGSRLPREKSPWSFDFDANPNIDPATVHTLASCEWIKKNQPHCLIGDSGTGKSHMLIALGTEAAMKGHRVRHTLATKLVNELVEDADENQLNKTIARYGRVDLLCIDELGYMELDRHGAELLFQVLTEREEKSSVAIASNESFGDRTKTCTDPRLCAAIVDRLTFNGTIIETGTDFYRLASSRARAEEPAQAG